jgi:hypothetical protein
MAAGSTYTPIATQTVSGGSTTSVSFTSIASTYTDIIAVIQGGASAGCSVLTQFNGDTATNYSSTFIEGDGTSAASGRNTTQANIFSGNAYNSQGNNIVQIQNYSNATTYKTALWRGNYAGNLTQAGVGLWRSTSAINRVDFLLSGGKFWNSGTTFTLYGIAAA